MRDKYVIFRILMGDDEVAFFSVPREREEDFEKDLSLLDHSLDVKCLSIISKSKYMDNMQKYNNEVADLFDNLFAEENTENAVMGDNPVSEVAVEI